MSSLAPAAYCPACGATNPADTLKRNTLGGLFAEYPCGTVKTWDEHYMTLDGTPGAWRMAVACVEITAWYEVRGRYTFKYDKHDAPNRTGAQLLQSVENTDEG